MAGREAPAKATKRPDMAFPRAVTGEGSTALSGYETHQMSIDSPLLTSQTEGGNVLLWPCPASEHLL